MSGDHETIIVIFGVSGVGKTTIGKLLSTRTGLPFYDADAFHPQSNIDKMSKGIALEDSDRLPWLKILNEQIKTWQSTNGAILACSALKEYYRRILQESNHPIMWVLLNGSKDLIRQRINDRSGHFMDDRLLNSQFDALEIPDYGIIIDVTESTNNIVDNILQTLKL